MGQTPDAVRAEIEGTRADMSLTMDAIGDRVDPRQVARRQARQVRHRFGAARNAVMGSMDNASDAAHHVGGIAAGQAQNLGQGVHQVPETVKSQTQGNPLAAGLIAFGAGLLLASILPPTEPERQLASKVGEAAQPALEQAQQSAQEVKQHLQGAAQEAAGQVKDAAMSATEQVKQDASASARDVAGGVREAVDEVRSQS